MQTGTPPPREDQDHSRAENYEILAALLSAPPSEEALARLAQLEAGETAFGRAWAALARAAAESDPAAVEREYFELFIGVGRGELLPYASFYVTGFLNERPLAELRGDLALLGVGRPAGEHEPEDRADFLCAVMAAYARGEFDALPEAPDESAFFARHLEAWIGLFFADLASAPAARLYAALAEVGREFIAIEQEAFALAAQERASV